MVDDGKNVKNFTHELCKVLKFLLFGWTFLNFFFSFFHVEMQFKINRIVSEVTKFNYLVSQLEPKCIENIWDIVTSNSATKYLESKTRLIRIKTYYWN